MSKGSLVYPRSRTYTRDEEKYPQYAGLTEWFNIDRGTNRYVVLAGDPDFMRSLVNNFFFAIVVIPLQTGNRVTAGAGGDPEIARAKTFSAPCISHRW